MATSLTRAAGVVCNLGDSRSDCFWGEGSHPHKGLELADVHMRCLDANFAQGLEEVASRQDAHLHAHI